MPWIPETDSPPPNYDPLWDGAVIDQENENNVARLNFMLNLLKTRNRGRYISLIHNPLEPFFSDPHRFFVILKIWKFYFVV